MDDLTQVYYFAFVYDSRGKFPFGEEDKNIGNNLQNFFFAMRYIKN